MGIRGVTLDWFTSYMSNRRQYVSLGKEVSSESKLEIGVQQGSLLGVLLFQIMINDLPNALRFCNSILYADDTTIYVWGRSPHFLKIKMQSDINHLSVWLCSNGLKLNVSKTECLLFNTEGLFPQLEMTINGQRIDCVNSYRFLGVTIDSQINFELHFEHVYKKLNQTCFIIRTLASIYYQSPV